MGYLLRGVEAKGKKGVAIAPVTASSPVAAGSKKPNIYKGGKGKKTTEKPSEQPTHSPSFQPTDLPSQKPSLRPSDEPTASPTVCSCSTGTLQTLLDQPVDETVSEDLGQNYGFIDQEFPDFDSFNSYQVIDVNFTNRVIICEMTTYFVADTIGWTSLIGPQARFNVFDDPLASSDDPTTGMLVDVTINEIENTTVFGGIVEVTAGSLEKEITAGSTVWLGLTPIVEAFALNGGISTRHPTSELFLGSSSFFRNPADFAGLGDDWIDFGAFFPCEFENRDTAVKLRGVICGD